MVSRMQRRRALCRKLHILRNLTSSKSVKKRSIIMDALLHIYQLRLKLEAMKRELSNLNAIKVEYLSFIKQVQLPKVKVEKKSGKVLAVTVTCKKGGDKLVSILEAFEEMGAVVLHARVSSNFLFSMEAIVAVHEKQAVDENSISQAILKAVER